MVLRSAAHTFVMGAALCMATPALAGSLSFEDRVRAQEAIDRVYDVLRSRKASDFLLNTTCLATDTSTESTIDSAVPAVGTAHFYLVRAQDLSPNGQGSLGTASNGASRTGRSCS